MQEIIRYYPVLAGDILYCYSESADEKPHKHKQGQQNSSSLSTFSFILAARFFYKFSEAAILVIA